MLVIILGCGARVWANCCAVCLAGWWAWSYEAGWSSGRRGSDNPHSSPSYCRCQRGSPAWQAWPAAGAAWGAELSVEASTEDLSGRTGQVARHGCLHPQLQLRPQKALTWERRLCTLGEGWWRGSSFYMLFCSPSLTFFSLPPSSEVTLTHLIPALWPNCQTFRFILPWGLCVWWSEDSQMVTRVLVASW